MLAWYRRLDEAASLKELVKIANEYFATLSPSEIELLPPTCRPRRLRDENDIEDMHSTLVEEYRVTRSEGDALNALQRITSFMVRASVRLTQLRGDDHPEDSPPPDAKRSALPRRNT